MPGLTQLVPRRNPDVVIDRLWLIFFSDGESTPWWSWFAAPGYRHVTACAWFAEQERWVYYNPTRRGTVILLYREDEFGGRFTQLMNSSSCVLRVRSTQSRRSTPFGWWCTGAVKALLGVKARALCPRALRDHLLRHGAEVVHMPGSEVEPHGGLIQT